MTATDELPVFPATAPDVFSDQEATINLLTPVLDVLAAVVDISPSAIDRPTPCRDYSVGDLQRHALAWLQFFADALNDPDGRTERLDPETWTLGDEDPVAIVRAAAARMVEAIRAGVADQLVVMSQARMRGDAVVAMALGEYIVHGWDLATATGQPWSVADAATIQARLFLEGTVAPEYRGEDSGFFGDEVAVPADASPLDQLLGFAGRDPSWSTRSAV